jgi:hypothetical protein
MTTEFRDERINTWPGVNRDCSAVGLFLEKGRDRTAWKSRSIVQTTFTNNTSAWKRRVRFVAYPSQLSGQVPCWAFKLRTESSRVLVGQTHDRLSIGVG